MAVELNYAKAAFIAYEPGAQPEKRWLIPFRFNPEGLSRSIAIEGGQRPAGVETGHGAAAPPAGESPAVTAAAVKESFTVHIRLDFADRDPSLSTLKDKFGIAPEIAAIEALMYPVGSGSKANSDGSDPTPAASPRPTVLLVWGRHRVVPVRIVSLKIDESVYNTELNPVRAELEVALEVLGEAEAKADTKVRSALDNLVARRRDMAEMFYANTSAQGSNILPV